MSISRVAQEAGVSYAAAWRAINGVAGVSEEARQGVTAAMQRLGFNQNLRRRYRRNRGEAHRHNVVALLVCRENTLLTSSMLRLVQKMVTGAEFNLIFGYMLEAGDLPPALRAGQVDGVLGYGELPSFLDPRLLENIPTVWLMSPHRDLRDQQGDRVMPDHLAIGRLAADYLANKGHQHVAFLNVEPNFHFGLRGYSFAEFTRRRGGDVVALQIEGQAVSLQRAAETLVERWRALSPRPTGLFIPKDGHLPAVCAQLQAAGVQWGRDIEIISCDNQQEILQRLDPVPVSIDLNQCRIVEAGIQRLFDRMTASTAPEQMTILIPPVLHG